MSEVLHDDPNFTQGIQSTGVSTAGSSRATAIRNAQVSEDDDWRSIMHAYLRRTGPEGEHLSNELNRRLTSGGDDALTLAEHDSELAKTLDEQHKKIRADFHQGSPTLHIERFKKALSRGEVSKDVATSEINRAKDAISKTSMFVRQTSLKRKNTKGDMTPGVPNVSLDATHEIVHPDYIGSPEDSLTAKRSAARASTWGPAEDPGTPRIKGEGAVVRSGRPTPEGVLTRPFKAPAPPSKVTGFTNQTTFNTAKPAEPESDEYGNPRELEGTRDIGGARSVESQRTDVSNKDRWKNLTRTPAPVAHLLSFAGEAGRTKVLSSLPKENPEALVEGDHYQDSIAHHLLHKKLTPTQVMGLKEALTNIRSVHGNSLQVPTVRKGRVVSSTQLWFCGHEDCNKLAGHDPVKGEPSHVGSSSRAWQAYPDKDDDTTLKEPYTTSGFDAIATRHKELSDELASATTQLQGHQRAAARIQGQARNRGTSPTDHPDWESTQAGIASLAPRIPVLAKQIRQHKSWISAYNFRQQNQGNYFNEDGSGFAAGTEEKDVPDPKVGRILEQERLEREKAAAETFPETQEANVKEAEKRISEGNAPKGTRIVYGSRTATGKARVVTDLGGEPQKLTLPVSKQVGEARIAYSPSSLPAERTQRAEASEASSTLPSSDYTVQGGRVRRRQWEKISPTVSSTGAGEAAEQLGQSFRVVDGARVPAGGWRRNLLEPTESVGGISVEQARAENAARPLFPPRRGVAATPETTNDRSPVVGRGSFYTTSGLTAKPSTEESPEKRFPYLANTPSDELTSAGRKRSIDIANARRDVETHQGHLDLLRGGSVVDALADKLGKAKEAHVGHLKTLEAARQEGDLRENAGYHAAKETVAKSQSSIDDLTSRLADARSGKLPDNEVTIPSLDTAVAIRSKMGVGADKYAVGSAIKVGSPEHKAALAYHTSALKNAKSVLASHGVEQTAPTGAGVTPRTSSSLTVGTYEPATRAGVEAQRRGEDEPEAPHDVDVRLENTARSSLTDRIDEATEMQRRTSAFALGRGM
jgi:transcription elongation factor GreA